jgi:hypothetical protein
MEMKYLAAEEVQLSTRNIGEISHCHLQRKSFFPEGIEEKCITDICRGSLSFPKD